MAKYRRKMEYLDTGEGFQEVEAYCFANDATSYQLLEWINQELYESQIDRLAQWVNDELRIPLRDGWFTLTPGDWLVQTRNGGIYPYSKELFNSIYWSAPEDTPTPSLADAKAELETTRAALIESIYTSADHIIEAAQTLRAGTDWVMSAELDTLSFDAAKLKSWAMYIFREQGGNG